MYKIVENTSLVEVERTVNRLMKDGWKLGGSLVISTYKGLNSYVQTLVKN